MGKKIAKICDIDGNFRDNPDSPVAVVREQDDIEYTIVDPIFNSNITRNLYGRIMTLVEATTESYKLKAVKDLFSKELNEWSSDVYESARDISTSKTVDGEHALNSSNIYLR